jgi:hypothetical protein
MEFEQAGDGSGFLLCLGILMAVCVAKKRASVTVDVDGSPPFLLYLANYPSSLVAMLIHSLSSGSRHTGLPARLYQ